MTEKVKAALEKYLNDCEKHQMVFVCKKLATQNGKDYVMSRLYDLMNANPTWTTSQCLAQVEIQLNEQHYY